MQLFVLVTIGEGDEEVLGVFSDEELAKTAATRVATERKESPLGFAYFPCTLNTLIKI
jgi:hypothetical protein